MRILFPLVLILLTGTTSAATLVHNVNGYSMLNGVREQFVALEYEAGVITAVYREADAAARSSAEQRIDGQGLTMLPGLIDAHGHVASIGDALASVDLTGTGSEAEAVNRIIAGSAVDPGTGWLTGRGWNQVLWEGGAFPTRESLDAAVPDRPVFFDRVDGHAAWVNSRALAAAGIDRNTPDPAGGMILRDDQGEPTGVLVDNAMDLVEDVMPVDSTTEKRRTIQRAMRHLVSLGMTATHDAGTSAVQMVAYDELAAEKLMPMRIYVMLSATGAEIGPYIDAGPRLEDKGMLSVRSVKISADGALGSRGAALMDDYSDSPGEKGLLLLSDEELRATMRRAASKGFQVNVHAIGDLANRRVLDEFEAINEEPRQRALRHRVEHAQILHPSDIARFEELDVIASVQPTHATSDKNMAGDRLGDARLEGAYAWQTLVESGARLAGGSDFPVEPADPFFGLHAAVTRRDRDGNPLGGWRPDEALSRDQTLSLFTEDAAYAGHAEDRLGRLREGYAADFILVRDDFFAVDAQKIWENRVRATVVDGQPVYQDPDAAGLFPE